MDDDPPLGNVEFLDEWDDDESPRPRRRTKTWLIGPLALLAIAAIVIAVVLGGTKPQALDPVPTELPTTPTPTALSYPSYSYVTVDASSGPITIGPDPAYTLEPIPSDAEAEPLLVTLLGKAERTDAMSVAFKVQICLRGGSAAAGGGKVRVSRNGWMLGLGDSSISPVSTGGLAPEFPDTAFLDAGQCVSGYVTFLLLGDAKYISLYYGDDRFSWSWRVS
jgi:hypothetical protein